MKCPFCGFENDKVVDSREGKEGESIRRRRECLKCEKRFTTYERIDEIPYMVVKKDGRREKFERQKVLAGLLRACEKRPVSMGKLEQIVNDAEGFVIDSADRERKTTEIGELIMNRLKRIDKVAYVRFASVYLDFKDVGEFMSELKDLLDTKENRTQGEAGRSRRIEAVAIFVVSSATRPGRISSPEGSLFPGRQSGETRLAVETLQGRTEQIPRECTLGMPWVSDSILYA